MRGINGSREAVDVGPWGNDAGLLLEVVITLQRDLHLRSAHSLRVYSFHSPGSQFSSLPISVKTGLLGQILSLLLLCSFSKTFEVYCFQTTENEMSS